MAMLKKITIKGYRSIKNVELELRSLNILIGPALPARVEVVLVAVYALAMVTSFPYVKLARVFRLPLWIWVVPAICVMISVTVTFAAIVGGYLISGPLLWIYRRGQRSRPALAR